MYGNKNAAKTVAFTLEQTMYIYTLYIRQHENSDNEPERKKFSEHYYQINNILLIMCIIRINFLKRILVIF